MKKLEEEKLEDELDRIVEDAMKDKKKVQIDIKEKCQARDYVFGVAAILLAYFAIVGLIIIIKFH